LQALLRVSSGNCGGGEDHRGGPRRPGRLAEQYRQGTLPPPVLCMLFHYAYRKPKERLEVDSKVDVLHFVITNQVEHQAVEEEPLELEDDEPNE
jgi:hypothetical protein